jgi:hypothetical protein
VGVQQHDSDDCHGEGDRHQRTSDEESDDSFRAAAHEPNAPFGPATATKRLVRVAWDISALIVVDGRADDIREIADRLRIHCKEAIDRDGL